MEATSVYAETFDRSVKDKQVRIHSESIDEIRSIENASIEVVNGSERSSDSERPIDVITRCESGENSYSVTHVNGTKSSSSSSRSSSSESSSDDFYRMDAAELASKSEKSYVDSFESSAKSEKSYVYSSESSTKSEVDDSPPAPTSTYQVYNLAGSENGMSPTVSPPIQVMDRSGRIDSARIPSSVFDGNNSGNSPLEWSIASNESLFSIHIGHHSFNRENTFKVGELHVSQESTKPDELNMLNRLPSVTIEEIDTASPSADIEKLEKSDESFKLAPKPSEDQTDIKTLHQSASSISTKSSVTSPSSESGTTGHAFVPLKKRSRPLCFGCNCSWAFCNHNWPTCCQYKWPTCCHAWPSCKCSCGWLLCGYCNGGRVSPILTETTESNSFMKTNTPSPSKHSYNEESETTSSSNSSFWYCFKSEQACDVCSSSNSNCCSWFYCFSCPSCTCKLSCTKCKSCC
ncbi:uncharacterized protein LOC131646556 [Vicia villosa]|uniref:uncharacterized protein LOC131646556 n=1 Tax=Vicia villosa TaxID=3911 RepID=UPI00273CEFC5|nr:uncharacterized protein LOC131646556 [Vicia villosa]